jgi:hypothetical protein
VGVAAFGFAEERCIPVSFVRGASSVAWAVRRDAVLVAVVCRTRCRVRIRVPSGFGRTWVALYRAACALLGGARAQMRNVGKTSPPLDMSKRLKGSYCNLYRVYNAQLLYAHRAASFLSLHPRCVDHPPSARHLFRRPAESAFLQRYRPFQLHVQTTTTERCGHEAHRSKAKRQHTAHERMS